MEINFIFLIVSIIIILGYIAEWAFKKVGIPNSHIILSSLRIFILQKFKLKKGE